MFLWSREAIRRFGPYDAGRHRHRRLDGALGAFPFATSICAFGVAAGAARPDLRRHLRRHPEPDRAHGAGAEHRLGAGHLRDDLGRACWRLATAVSGPIYDAVGVWGFLCMVPVAGLAWSS